MAKHKYKKRRENQLLREEQAKAQAEAMAAITNKQPTTKEPDNKSVTEKKQKPAKETSDKKIPKEKTAANKSKDKAKSKQASQSTANNTRKLSPTALTCIILAAIVVLLGVIAGVFYLTLPDVAPFTTEVVAGEEIGLLYKTDAPYNSYTKMTFELDGKTYQVDPVDNNGMCSFFFTQVSPHQLGHTIKASLTMAGVTKQTDDKTSVLQAMLTKMESNELAENDKKLYSELIQYAEYARIYNNRLTPVQDDVSLLELVKDSKYGYNATDVKAYIPATMYGFGMSTSPVELCYINVTYSEGSRYNLVIRVPADSNISYTDVTVKVNGTEYNLVETSKVTDTEFSVLTNVVPYSQWLQKAAVSVYVKGELVQESTFGLMDYIARIQPTEGNETELHHAKALYYYATAFQNRYATPEESTN